MKNNHLVTILTFILLTTVFTGCEVVGAIFEAGIWVGVIIVVLVIVLVFWIIAKLLG